MSIETRAGPTSRSFRSLIKNTRRMAKPIKDLKDLSILRVCAGYRHSGPTDLKKTRDVFSRERWRGTGPRPTVKGGFSPPVARGPVPRERWIARAMAKGTRSPARMETCEGPRPTMKGAFCRRCPGRQGIFPQAGLMPSAALLHRDQEVSPTGQVILRKAHGKSPKTDWNI